jgi:Tat protein secretion system quality control protein TatD with DNase activity
MARVLVVNAGSSSLKLRVHRPYRRRKVVAAVPPHRVLTESDGPFAKSHALRRA